MKVCITAYLTYKNVNDVTLSYTEEDSRTEIELSYYSEESYLPETLVLGADSEMRLTDLLKEQLDELKAFMDCDFEEQELLSENEWQLYDIYPKDALAAFRYVIENILTEEQP